MPYFIGIVTRLNAMSRSIDDNQAELCESELLQRDHTVYLPLARKISPKLTVQRLIPQRGLRMVGPWCFVDHFGPLPIADYADFDIAPHPHCGLQTITWLFSGQLVHHDSLGYQQALRRDQLNLMTSGHGISHAEVADSQLSEPLHGLQLWSALPPSDAHTQPRFDHYPQLPKFTIGECTASLLVGSYRREDHAQAKRFVSPALSFHPSIAMIISTPKATAIELQLEREFEHALYVVSGRIDSVEQRVDQHQLLNLGSNRSAIAIELSADCKLLLIGGEAFAQPIRMWWNFVAADMQQLQQAQQQWNVGHARFGQVSSYQGERLLAPELPAKEPPAGEQTGERL
jgi:redox-sensitive bicupin YhaK (pirin superfamily)